MKFILFGLLLLSPTLYAQKSLNELNRLKPPFSLPALPYAENALEPVIDQETMKIHHSKHHKAYVDNLNKALGDNKSSLLTLLQSISKQSAAVRNNAGGHWNHSFFWTILSSDKKDRVIPQELETEINATFGSLEKFKEEFEKKGTALFGSGWVWLIRNKNSKLEITTTINQDNPLMDVIETQGVPILALDVWEHAYYLKYQNKRADYIKNFWEIVNWKQVQKYNVEALKLHK